MYDLWLYQFCKTKYLFPEDFKIWIQTVDNPVLGYINERNNSENLSDLWKSFR